MLPVGSCGSRASSICRVRLPSPHSTACPPAPSASPWSAPPLAPRRPHHSTGCGLSVHRSGARVGVFPPRRAHHPPRAALYPSPPPRLPPAGGGGGGEVPRRRRVGRGRRAPPHPETLPR